MLDPYLLRNNLNTVAKKLAYRGFKLDIEQFSSLEETRRTLQVKKEYLQFRRNTQSKAINQAKLRGEDVRLLHIEIKKLCEELAKVKSELEASQSEMRSLMLKIPNIPDESVPIGKDENCNIEVKRWGTPREFDFKVRDHVVVGEMHGGISLDAAVKLSGSRFVVMKGQIAHMHRALTQFMLDLHTENHGYSETYVPYLVNQETLYATGQLPKFASDLFYTCFLEEEVKKSNYALIPTAEVPLINLVRNEILDESDLPIKLTAHSTCFRSEAGSYGRDTRGLIRMHQFDKVEIVQIVHPEDSMNALEEMTMHAETVLEMLKLPYRRMVLCTGDLSFASCKTYDLEVWIPAQNKYREVSSCSNVWDFQSRRMQARFRNKLDKKIRLVHTLNGSGIAVDRTLVAVLENYQLKDGRVKIPEVLRPYMKRKQYIE